MANPIYLGRRIRSLRLRMGVSQADLAKRLGISPSYLNLLEHDGLRRARERRLPQEFVVDRARVDEACLQQLAGEPVEGGGGERDAVAGGNAALTVDACPEHG